jgi:hypothetical protein
MKGDQRVLTITVPKADYWDKKNQEFITPDADVLELEHSLIALSKWESKYKIPFLGKTEKTTEQVFGYIEAMTLTANASPEIFSRLSVSNLEQINEYINDPMTATWFTDLPGPTNTSSEVITNELIYYWMSAFDIPMECQTWHLNKLFTLIKVSNLKNQKPKKMTRQEALDRQRRLNEERRAQSKTQG